MFLYDSVKYDFVRFVNIILSLYENVRFSESL